MSSSLDLPTAPRAIPCERIIAALTLPLDALRSGLWRASAMTAFGRACIRDRGLRLTTLGLGHLLAAALLTAFFPLWLLLAGPLLLGIPHLVGDVRYLILRGPAPLGRLGLTCVLLPLLLMTLHRVGPVVGLPFSAALEVILAALAIASGLAFVRASAVRRLTGLIVVALVAAHLAASPERSQDAILGMAHLHNLIAFGLWLFVMRGEVRLAQVLALVLTYGAVVAVFLSGLVDPLLASAQSIGHFDLRTMTASLAPDLPHEQGLRWVGLFAFAQAFHYAIWIRLIPQRLDERPAPPTFRRSLSRVASDLGRAGFIAVALVALALPLSALLLEPTDVRHVYLVAAIGHGWLEVAIIAALLTRGRRVA